MPAKPAFASADFPSLSRLVVVVVVTVSVQTEWLLVPWKKGKARVWDVTVADTLAPSHFECSFKQASSAVPSTEKLKHSRYKNAKEKSGSCSGNLDIVFRELGKLLVEMSGNSRFKN